MSTKSANPGEDISLIQNLIAQVALYADVAPIEDYATLFTSDAVWEIENEPPIEGLDAIVTAARGRRAEKVTGPDSNSRHVVLSSAIDVAEDEAQASSIFQFYTGFDTTPVAYAMGTYRDAFRREAGNWRLQRRFISWRKV